MNSFKEETSREFTSLICDFNGCIVREVMKSLYIFSYSLFTNRLEVKVQDVMKR